MIIVKIWPREGFLKESKELSWKMRTRNGIYVSNGRWFPKDKSPGRDIFRKWQKNNDHEDLDAGTKWRLRRKRPKKRWKKCNPVRKKKRQEKTESLIDKPMILNSLICKLINVQASMKENNEKKINEFLSFSWLWELTLRWADMEVPSESFHRSS